MAGPTGGAADHAAAGSDPDWGGDFDQAGAPRFEVTFAERIAIAATVEEAAAVGSGELLTAGS